MEPSQHDPLGGSGLHPIEAEFVRFFVKLALALNMPRSVGEIFGFLFAADEPRAFNEVVASLGISKGSASHGLKLLTQIGAIAPVYVARDRRTFYEAETSMRKLFSRALENSVRPHLEGNARLVEGIEERIASDQDVKTDHYRHRLSSLRHWNEKALALLPLLDELFALPAPLFPFHLPGGEASGPPPSSPPGH